VTTASHIHCCTPGVQTGTAGVATITPTFTGFSAVGDQRILRSYLRLDECDPLTIPAFVSLNGTPGRSGKAALIGGMLTGEELPETSTPQIFPGGEIRGFLVYVPEPVTLSVVRRRTGRGPLFLRPSRKSAGA